MLYLLKVVTPHTPVRERERERDRCGYGVLTFNIHNMLDICNIEGYDCEVVFQFGTLLDHVDWRALLIRSTT